jgi:hypothetical protein
MKFFSNVIVADELRREMERLRDYWKTRYRPIKRRNA